MEMIFGNCVGVNKRKMERDENDTSISLGESGKRSRPFSNYVDFQEDGISLSSLDAMACPPVRAEQNKIHDCITALLELLDKSKTNCAQLQDRLRDKGGYYSQRNKDLQQLHRSELDKERAFLALSNEQFTTFRTQLQAENVEHKRIIESLRLEVSQKNQELWAAEEREMILKGRFNALESYSAGYLRNVSVRHEQCQEYIKMITNELESLRASNDYRERELRYNLNLAHNEISVLRTHMRWFGESVHHDSGICSARNSELARLENEVNNLRYVLEWKQKENSDVINQNEKLMRDVEEHTQERAVLTDQTSKLELSKEILTDELEIKSQIEKDLLRQIDELQENYNDEKRQRLRLSYDNEELQRQLKQRSEQLHILEAKLHEHSAMESHNPAIQFGIHSLNRSQFMNGSSLVNIQTYDFPPPISPMVKGAVSRVLEMDGDTPEAAAPNMMTHADSFHSIARSPLLSRDAGILNTSLIGMQTSRLCSEIEEDLAVEGRRDDSFYPICSISSHKLTKSNAYNSS